MYFGVVFMRRNLLEFQSFSPVYTVHLVSHSRYAGLKQITNVEVCKIEIGIRLIKIKDGH